MASARALKWRVFLMKTFPWLFKKCPGGNNHFRWDQHCFCMTNEHCGDEGGGVYLFKSKTWWVRKEDYINTLKEHQKWDDVLRKRGIFFEIRDEVYPRSAKDQIVIEKK